MCKLISVLLFILPSLVIVYCDRPLVRNTNNGPVEGIEQTSSLGQKYYAFKGIPFAEPPITGVDPYTGENVDRRFKAPVPLERKWKKNLKVHNFSDFCIQSMDIPGDSTSSKTSENCLFVNVYVPAGGAKQKTVLIWIHGGGFAFGDAGDMMYGPDFLLSEDNIVVTVQYRLGIFGFLNLGFGKYTGNMGLKDQQLAMKWVYENIENFSGNKNKILLFGESAGGASVGFHLINEDSRNYFNRAFLSSSSAFSFYALSRVPHLQKMKDFSKISSEEELVEYLKTEASGILAKSLPFDQNSAPWVPTIESSKVKNAFMTKMPNEIYNSKNVPIMDVLFSFNSKEGLAFRPDLIGSNEPLIKKHIEESKVDLPFDGFNMTSYPKEYKRSLKRLKRAYYKHASDGDSIERENFNLVSDITFVDSILKAVIFQATANHGVDKTNRRNTFMFRFSVNSDINLQKVQGGMEYDGATHADDLCYYFYCHMLDHKELYDKHLKQKDAVYDQIMRMVKMISNFARTGNPSIEDDTPFKSCVSPNKTFCQEISNRSKTSVTTNIKEQRHYKTWREIEEIYNNLKKTM